MRRTPTISKSWSDYKSSFLDLEKTFFKYAMRNPHGLNDNFSKNVDACSFYGKAARSVFFFLQSIIYEEIAHMRSSPINYLVGKY